MASTLLRFPEQPFLYAAEDNPWIKVRDGNDTARAIFNRHYSRRKQHQGSKNQFIFVGPGRKLVLLTVDARALFIWRNFISQDQQEGYNCAVFRNEGQMLSSDLIRAADELVDDLWGRERHYTYVNPNKVRSTNPGCCFLKAGWQRIGMTKRRNLYILSREI